MKEGLVRADTLPLVFKALGAEGLPRHAKVRVRITGVDLLTLEVHASVTARLDAAQDAQDTEGDAGEDEDGEVLDNAGALTLAIDVADAEASPAPGGTA